MKCEKCGNKIEPNFLNKIFGTIIKEGKKKHYFCRKCQKEGEEKLKNEIA